MNIDVSAKGATRTGDCFLQYLPRDVSAGGFGLIYRYHNSIGQGIPSVTEIIGELLPQWQADEWYLERGTAVHACCALIAQGKSFTNDPAIDGQVKAARTWFRDFKPVVLEWESRYTSERYQYGGTMDLVCKLKGQRVIVDFKASLTETVPYQLGGYAELVGDVNLGLGVELKETGEYKVSGFYGLRTYRRAFLALRTVYGIRAELGMLTKEEE